MRVWVLAGIACALAVANGDVPGVLAPNPTTTSGGAPFTEPQPQPRPRPPPRGRTSNTTVALERINATLQGLEQYFQERSYFDACGQIGGQGGEDSFHCACAESQGWCLNCYRWWTGHTLETLANVALFAHINTTAHVSLANHAYTQQPFTSRAFPMWAYVDDYLWWVLADLRVYEWLGDAKWLTDAQNTLDFLWERAVDGLCGGIYWLWPNNDTKNSVTTLEAVAALGKLARASSDKSAADQYTQKALALWGWFQSVSLVGDDGLVRDGAAASTDTTNPICCNGTSAGPFGFEDRCVANGTRWSYNQGLLLSSAALLANLTNDPAFVDAALASINATIENMTSAEGVLKEPLGAVDAVGDKCDSTHDPAGPNADRFSFKGVYMMHLLYFLDLVPLTDAEFLRVYALVTASSDGAWALRAEPPFSPRDMCGNVTGVAGGPPKFPWYWDSESHAQHEDGARVCMDARTQGAALDLFVAHFVVEEQRARRGL